MSNQEPSVPSGGASRVPSTDTTAIMRYDANKKNIIVAYLLWFFLGMFGGHRFYLGNIGTAVIILALTIIGYLTLILIVGGFLLAAAGIWVLVDAFLIPGKIRRFNNDLISGLTGQ